MLLKKISLHNFRQFKGSQELEFATDLDKNVTIVMAEGGVGKTTLAQAFQWVLYGSADGFKDKVMLNLKVKEEMPRGSEDIVSVSLVLVHNDIEYKIDRTQKFKKDINGEVRSDYPELEISYFTKDHQIDFIKDVKKDSTISSILPSLLSKYFFFDGERIEKMSAEVKAGKSQEFSEAVQGLLGLTALLNTIEHLKPNTKDSVIGRYDQDIDEQGDQRTRELRTKIYEAEEFLSSAQKKFDEIDSQIKGYKDSIEDAKVKIASFAEAEKAQQTLNRLEAEVKREQERKVSAINDFLQHFSRNTASYFSKILIQNALEELDKSEKIDKGIPDIRDTTIKFLMNRGRCICGEDLSDHTSTACRELMEVLKVIPPESIGTGISSFGQASSHISKSSATYYSTAKSLITNIRTISNIISAKEDEQGDIDKTILKSQNLQLADLKKSQIDWEREISRLENERRDLDRSVGATEKDKLSYESEISKLQLIDDKNKTIEIQRQYALAVFDKVKKTYDYQERQVREELEQEINSLFQQIYADGMAISIDDKYKINVFVNELSQYSSNIDHSTSQSYSVIFAFIVGIIKMAKTKKNNENELVDTEAYPLVMDAPLSAFDERRINNICSVIPKIARQVIIFIKDTDGKIAKDNLKNSIGKEYELKTRDDKSLVDTYIEKRGEY